MLDRKNLSSYIFILLIAVCITGCVNLGKVLNSDQRLLVKQKIKGNKKTAASDLATLYQQKHNQKILGFLPRLAFYRFGDHFHDSAKIARRIAHVEAKYEKRIGKQARKGPKTQKLLARRDKKIEKLRNTLEEGNWIMRNLGEPPHIFDISKAEQTVQEIQTYLFNHGYFHNKANFVVDTLNRRQVKVVYKINEQEPFKIQQINYITDNANIRQLIDSTKAGAEVKVGQIYDQDKLVEERDRLTQILRNSGYFGFSRDYIFVENDTTIRDTLSKNKLPVNIDIVIKNPPSGRHKVYKFSEINFYLEEGNGAILDKKDTTQFQGVNYISFKRGYSYRVLDAKLLVGPEKVYRQNMVTNSQAQLAAMDIFKFVNFNYDTSANDFKLNIVTSRLPKYQISDELGVIMSQGAPGPFVNVGFKIRNPLGSFEIFEISTRYSEEGQFSAFLPVPDSIYRAREIGVNASLSFPELVLPGQVRYKFNAYNPRTRLVLGYTSVRRPEYSRNIIKGTMSYTIQPNKSTTIGLSPIDASLNFTPRINPNFEAILQTFKSRGNSLSESFNNSLITNINAFYVYNTSMPGVHKKAAYIRLFAEWGGEIPTLISNSERKDSLIGLKIFRYSKFNADARYYLPVSKKAMLAMRINTGIAFPRGSSEILPWEKYFFTGGSNNIRAWAPRRLGPGSYSPRDAENNVSLVAEQPGEILLETNLELRRPLIGFFEGAFFVDAGNIWMLHQSETRPGAQFQFNDFWKEIAVGTGIGLRLNFSFLIVRVDIGTKVHDPAQPVGQRFVLNKFSQRNNTLLNLGIGYPF